MLPDTLIKVVSFEFLCIVVSVTEIINNVKGTRKLCRLINKTFDAFVQCLDYVVKVPCGVNDMILKGGYETVDVL